MSKSGRPIHRTDFGARLYEARVAAGLSQRDACRALGLSPPTLSEAERYSQGSSHVARFARLYGVSAEWLSTGQGVREAHGQVDAFGPRLSPAALEIAQQFDAAPADRKRVLYAVILDEIRRLSRPAETPTPAPAEPPSAAPRPSTGKGRAPRPAGPSGSRSPR